MARAAYVLGLVCLLPAIGVAQEPPPTITTARGIQVLYADLKKNMPLTAEKLSDADYSFRPTSEILTFEQLIALRRRAVRVVCSGEGHHEPTTGSAELRAIDVESGQFVRSGTNRFHSPLRNG